MNQELKKEILKLCREQYVADLCDTYLYEINKGPLCIRMQIRPNGSNAVSYYLTVLNNQQTIYRNRAHIYDFNGVNSLALTAHQYDMKEISEAMIRNVQEQQRALAKKTSSEYKNAQEALSMIRNVFNNEKTK